MTTNNIKYTFTIDNQDQALQMIISGKGKRNAGALKKLIDTSAHSFDTLTDIERLARKSELVPEDNLVCFLDD